MTTAATGAIQGVAVNGRFIGRAVTGVERYATELLRQLPEHLAIPCAVLQPRQPLGGIRGHAWEQLVLPRLLRRSGADVLVSLANFGPVLVERQLVVIHDVAPFLLPDRFASGYRRQAQMVQRALARRCRLATVSQASRRDLARILEVDAQSITVIPPAVGPPFTDPDLPTRDPVPRAVLVGGHDPRKNATFLADRWPDLHASTGLELHIVARSHSASLAGPERQPRRGVAWHLDLDDRALAKLYASSRFIVQPSDYEGFGLPLLEGMACGIPFLSTDVGAATELACDPEQQLLPLEPEAWMTRLVQWATADLSDLATASRERAASWTWRSSAKRLADAVLQMPS